MLSRLAPLAALLACAALSGGCAGGWPGSTRSAGLAAGVEAGGAPAPTAAQPVTQAPLPRLAPGPLLTADWADVPRVVPADPKPVTVREEGAAPAPGLPKVERAEAAPAEPALVFVRGVGESAGQPSIESLAGEAPVYSIEVPNAPPAATFVAPDTVSNGLAGGEAALLGRVIDINPVRRGPVPDAWLTVVSAADPTARARIRTDAQGRYRLLDVEPGGYFVVAEKDGLGKTRPQYVLLTTNMGPGVDFAFYSR